MKPPRITLRSAAFVHLADGAEPIKPLLIERLCGCVWTLDMAHAEELPDG